MQVKSLPGNTTTHRIQAAEGPQQHQAFVLLPAQRGQRESRQAAMLKALRDRAPEHRVGADLHEDRTAVVRQGFDRRREAHGLSYVTPPVQRAELLAGAERAGHRRDERDNGGARLQAVDRLR